MLSGVWYGSITNDHDVTVITTSPVEEMISNAVQDRKSKLHADGVAVGSSAVQTHFSLKRKIPFTGNACAKFNFWAKLI